MRTNHQTTDKRPRRPRLTGRAVFRALTPLAVLLALCFSQASAGAQPTVPDLPPGKMFGALPKQNTALYLGWRGRVDTQLDFSEFFHGDHTIMCWFMPQYPYGYEGPLFAENGGGFYAVGQGDYRSGDGGFDDGGSAVLFIRVGNKKVIYLAPALKPDKWQHVAVVRKNDVFKLYLNGVRLTPVKIVGEDKPPEPDSEIKVPRSYANKPSGTLRFGRRGDGTSDSERNWQAYGLLDDVAVFKKALTAPQIGAVIEKKRLTGFEKDLLAGWCFDKPGDTPLPQRLASPREDGPRTYKVPVSADRDSAADAAAFNNPLIIGETQVALKLPFDAGEVWKVVQGYDSATGSHNGSAAFCYDFARKDPAGAAYAPLVASAAGKVVAYTKDGPLNSVGHETNRVIQKIADGEYVSYRHLAANSLPDDIKGGTCNANGVCFIPEAEAPSISQGSFIGKVGPKARHLHIGGRNGLEEGTTIPVAFSDYWASDDGGKTWVHIFRGHPKSPQLIKR